MHFTGTLVVTDPCYLMPDDDAHAKDWERCYFGEHMEVLGVRHYISRDTIYGDWSCDFFDMDGHNTGHSFCADAGMVIVTTMEEIQKYNPDFARWAESHNWCVAVIPDFDGEAEFIEAEGETGDRYVYVQLSGSHDYHSEQTGF